jgi:hypothetical protein
MAKCKRRIETRLGIAKAAVLAQAGVANMKVSAVRMDL